MGRKRLSKRMFRTSGSNARLEIDDDKAREYYFDAKMDEEEAREKASEEAAEILDTRQDSLRVYSPRLKHDFYCIYEAENEKLFTRVRKEEIGVQEQLIGAMIGKEIIKPRKGRDIPGRAIKAEIVELFATETTVEFILDGVTGFAANTLENLLTGRGKHRVTSAWKRKITVSPGKYKDLDDVVKRLAREAKKKPHGAKRVIDNKLDFKKLRGFYVPTYYVTVKKGNRKIELRINAVNRDVRINV
ncbi:MAG: hypothetical protein GF309_08295 [Candidatus Lokiarchaeota archaeon]|nr:hypothetical protein [Candidatus Lokiarchaeota archaeon]